MNKNYICVFDFETGGRNPHTCEILQIGAIIIDNRTLEEKDQFQTKMKPHNMDALEDDALGVTGITREELLELSDAYYPETIWPQFVAWVNKYNKSKKNPSPYHAPVAAGYNINGFDMPVLRRYCKKYGPWDEKRGDQKVFSQVFTYDLQAEMWTWFEHSIEPENLRLSTVAEWLGLDSSGAHDALFDCRMCSIIIRENMRRKRESMKKMNYMKGKYRGLGCNQTAEV
jgi:DNA polymerase III epsilon subunit-like protein